MEFIMNLSKNNYGLRYQWDILRYHKWSDWDELFCEIKTYWNTKVVKYWREKILKRFVYSLPSVRNPIPCTHTIRCYLSSTNIESNRIAILST